MKRKAGYDYIEDYSDIISVCLVDSLKKKDLRAVLHTLKLKRAINRDNNHLIYVWRKIFKHEYKRYEARI